MADILLTKKYKSKNFNIPFYESQTKLSKVKIKVDRIASNNKFEERRAELIEQAYKEFVTSYFPEFYSYLYDSLYFQQNCDPNANKPNCDTSILDVANELKQELIEEINVESWFQTDPPGNQSIVIFKTLYDFDAKRDELESNYKMPLYEPNLEFFNNQQGLTGPVGETTLTVGTIGEDNKLLNNGLRTFDSQYKGFEGQINLNVDFNVLGVAATKLLNIIVTELTKQTRIQSPSYDFSEADTITIIFGKKGNKLAIFGMDYLLIEKSIQSQPLKVGYFSIAKYNKILQDPLTLAVLRNYRNILTSLQNSNDQRSNYSFFDFLDNDEVKDSLGSTGTIFDNFNPQPKKDLDNELLKVANQFGLIDVNDTEGLEKGFTTFFTTEELNRIRNQVAENPDVYKRVAAARKAKALNTAANVTKVIGDILESGPLGFVSQNNPEVAYLFRQLGVDEIAKEAFLCLTFGLNFEIGRINKAVQNSLVRASSSIYYPPDLPKEAPINRPKVDLEQFKPFTVDNDLWREIQKTIVDSIQQSVLEVVKKLADLLRENCDLNSPRSNDYGENDIADFIQNNPNPENTLLPAIGAGSQLDQISSKNSMTNQQIIDYLSDLSSILSSIDICILFMNREDASDELIDRIIEYNQNYTLESVRNGLVSRSDIMGFFADLSATVDVTDLCNQIANELFDLNQENICLITGDDDENIQELLNLIEDGLAVDIPNIDLNCPDSEFASPLVTKSIPETFNVLAEAVQIQFISSADSAREILLEPVLSNDSRTLQDIKAAQVDPGGNPIDLAFLQPIIGIFETIEGTIDLANCPVDVGEILGFDAETIDNVQEVLGVVNETLQDPNFTNAIQGISNKVGQISKNATAGAGGDPVFTTYKFNQEFFNSFKDYIDPETFTYSNNSSETQKFYTSDVPDFVSGDSLNSFYNDVTLRFKFKDLSGEDYLRILYPEYVGTPQEQVQSNVTFQTTLLSDEQQSAFESINKQTNATLEDINNNPGVGTKNENLFIKKFADKILPYIDNNEVEAYYKYFPQAYGVLVDNMFDYVMKNGVFDAATLQSLNLFFLNENCPPDEVADFLDIQGIVDQMIEEYKEIACGSENNDLSSNIRSVIKFGMYLLLVQIHIAEVIIKNIFVMSAFNLESLLDRNNFVFQFVRGQILQSLKFYFSDEAEVSEESRVRQDLTKYFNSKILRPLVIEKGGITYVDDTVAFNTGQQFSITDEDTFVGFDEILDYLIYDRVLRSAKAISNALKKALPDKKQLPFDKAFIASLPRLAVSRDDQSSVASYIIQEQISDYLPTEGFFLTVKTRVIDLNSGNKKERRRFKLWWKSTYDTSNTVYVANILDLGTKSKIIGELTAEDKLA